MPHALHNLKKRNTNNLDSFGMAAGFQLNGSALNKKEPDSAITSRCDPRTETKTEL
jgi:hypothetical protein